MDPFSAVVGAAGGASALYLALKNREHRKPRPGLTDQLPYHCFVDEATIMGKDGSLLRAWSYRGPDMETATDNDLNSLSAQINAALRPFGDGWMFHVDAVRRPSTAYDPGTGFRSATAKLFDLERQQAYAKKGAHFETKCYLVATYLPSEGLSGKMSKGLVSSAEAETDGFEKKMDDSLGDFAREIESLEDRLGSIIKLKPLKGAAFLEHLHGCITGHDHPVALPERGAYLSRMLASEPFVGGLAPRIGGREILTISVTGFPNFTQMGLLDKLGELGVSYRWSTRFIPLTEEAVDAQFKKSRKQWVAKRDGLKKLFVPNQAKGDAPDPDAELFQDGNAGSLGRDAADALALNASKEVRFGYYTSVVVLMGPEREALNKAGRRVLKSLRTAGLTARIDDYNASDAFMGTIPGLGRPNLCRPVLNTRNLAHLLPLTSPWPGEATNPCGLIGEDQPPLVYAKTEGTTPFRLNIHDGDVGHTLIVGSTGAGKSVLVGALGLQFMRYENAQTFIFDVGYAHYLGCIGCGGRHYDLMSPDRAQGEKGPSFQPLAGIDVPTERAWALEWVLGLLETQSIEIKPQQREVLDRALMLVASNPRPNRTMTLLMNVLQDTELRAGIKPYTGKEVYGSLFDSNEDGIALGAQQVFEMKHVNEMSNAVVVPALTYLFHRLEQRLDGSPTLIVIEEAWSALMNGRFADKLREWLLTLRKRNASVVLVAHSPAQFEGEAKVQMLASSCYTKIFLPNPEAREERIAELYRTLGLNDKELQVLAGATKKRDYLLKNTNGSRLFQLGFGPVAASLFASRRGLSMEKTIKEAQRVQQAYGDEWFGEWLEGAGASGEADQWREIHAGMRSAECRAAGPLGTAAAEVTAPAMALSPAEVA
jgi:type IV secretion system protein VirB4